MMYYADGDIDAMMRGFQKLNPGQFASIVEYSLDDKLFLIHSTSDIDASKFWLLAIEAHHLSKIGAPLTLIATRRLSPPCGQSPMRRATALASRLISPRRRLRPERPRR